jgi:Spy/CpxP family protein refolding chaperone
MKRIISVALALTLFAGTVQAQTTDKGDRRHKGERKEMPFNKLNLTADQKAKFQSLREAQRKEMQDLRKTGSVTPEQRKTVHEKYKTQYEAILTPAQREEFNKQKTDWKEKAGKGDRAGKKGDNWGAPAAYFKKELNLTTDQETKLTAIFQEFRTKAQDIRTNNNLSQEQKRTQMQTLSQQYMTQGKALLTPEQLKKFDELQDKRGNRRNRTL